MVLALWAALQPDDLAIASPHGTRTFRELNARANQLTRGLRSRGFAAGDSIALLCSNRPEFAEVLAAAHRSGLRLTPINWHLTADEAGYILDDCEAKVLVVDARFAETARAAASRAPMATVLLAVGGAIDGFESYDAAIGTHDPSNIDDPTIGGTMLYTSGTTGRPKGVYRPLGAAAAATQTASARLSAAMAAEGPSMHLCTGPLYHAAPLAFSLAVPLAQGMGVVLMDGWDAEETLRLIEAYRITHTHMVPTMFHRLLSLPEAVRSKYDTSSLRFVIHGAAPCPVPVKRALLEWWGPIVYEYYAATEGGATFVAPEEWLARPGTVGKPLTKDYIRILDDGGQELPAGEVGTIYLYGAASAGFAYYKDAAKTAAAFRDDHFTLGDVGYLDEDGYLFLTDRSADVLISGGVNIYPAEVEAVLIAHTAVGDVAVIGVPNDEWGEEVKAVVETQPGVLGSPTLEAELIGWCQGRLARFKCPRTIDFVPELPRQDNGKLYKRLLRERYRQEARS